MNDHDHLVRLIAALSRWNHQLVFVGGWAHRLYRLHPDAQVPIYEPIATLDVDVAFDYRERLDGDMRECLVDAGFKEELSGRHQPPVSKYTVGDATGSGFYAEFLTPLVGRETTREGARLAPLEKAGVTAQRLRYLELLLVSPWNVTLPPEWGTALEVRVPNPVSYIVQKLLIHDRRPNEKKAQDILYIHDTIELFGEATDALQSLWTERVRQALHPNWRTTLKGVVADIFGTLQDQIRVAATIPQDRRLDPERMRRMCFTVLDTILD